MVSARFGVLSTFVVERYVLNMSQGSGTNITFNIFLHLIELIGQSTRSASDDV